MLAFLLGTLFGAALVLFIILILVVDPWGPKVSPPPFIDQYRPVEIPKELRDFLKTGDDGQGISRWESCHSISVFLHMLFQEHKDTRLLRRWFHKRLQIELNDISTRSAAGRLIQEIRIRDLSLGTKFPRINAIRVENVEMAEDKNIFEKITLLIDMDYTGGFETSIDVTTVFGKKANLSIKLTKLAGLVRLILSRKPYSHWSSSFISTPELGTEVSSQIQGHQLKRLIPLIKESIRRALQRKHVWPNYKIRYRPLFPNPFLQPSPPLSAFAHIKIEGGLEVTVLQASRLKAALLEKNPSCYVVYCTATLDHRPFMQSSTDFAHSFSVMLTFSRHDMNTPTGLIFEKSPSNANGSRPVRVAIVEEGSLAEKAAFKPGDTLIAINNVPIRSERQVVRFLQQTIGDLLVLVDRNLDDIDDDALKDDPVESTINGNNDDGFVCLGEVPPPRPTIPERRSLSPGSDSHRRHSMSNIVSAASMVNSNTDSVASSLLSLDGHFDRPVVASVLRTESDRVPHVLVSQASTDLRRTRSESELLPKALDSISVCSSVSGVIEDEIISVYTMSSLGSEPTNEHVMPSIDDIVDHNGTLTPGILTPRAKDDTLTPGMTMANVEKEMEAAALLPPTTLGGQMAESISSIASSLSLATEDGAEDEGGLNRNRPASTRKQRLHVALQASKRKVLDLMQKRRPVTPSAGSDNVEMGADAGDLEGPADPDRESPLPSTGKRSPVEMQVVDKKEKRKKSKNRSPSIRQAQPSQGVQDSPTSSLGFARSKTTKSVHFRENVLWGQSLHYELDGTSSSSPTKASCKYLNVTIHAKEAPVTTPTAPTDAPPGGIQPAPIAEVEPPKPILLGYTSLYVPQILDDCQMTLSNCHREVYQLKPPTGIQSINEPLSSEFSRHAGHDPRLCYGDVTLGFRFFPGGLPEGAGVVGTEESDEEIRVEETLEGTKSSVVPSAVVNLANPHEWKPWSSKTGSAICSMCRGKIWLKSASCCQRCLVICHHKCVERAATGIACTPHAIAQADAQFAELDVDAGEQKAECPTSVIPATPQTTQPPATVKAEDVELTSRRVRLRNKVTEKFSSWRRSAKPAAKLDLDGHRDSRASESSAGTALEGEEMLSPMASIQDCLADVLPTLDGSPFIRSLYFQPGNAYNEQTISHAKVLGREIFSNLKGEERRAKINEQIDRIQLAIRETKDGRLEAMKKEGTDGKSGATFEGLDERLQALAVLMLHYCAALQDCESQGRESPVYDSELPPETTAETHSLSGSSPSKTDTPAHQSGGSVVVFEPATPPSDHEVSAETSAQEELNQTFIMVNEEPDPRLEP
ncbi:hypothetical protein V3C99_007022 [Haemonchus contortus]